MSQMTEAELRTKLEVLAGYNGLNRLEAVVRDLLPKLQEAATAVEEVTEMRKQLKKLIRERVGLEMQLMELQAQLENAGDPLIMVHPNAFIVGKRDELALDQIEPGWPIIFTDEPSALDLENLPNNSRS